MRLLRGLASLAARRQPCVATLGAFDAFHIGHRAVIQKTQSMARQHQLPATLLTFEPLPGEFFAAADNPLRRIYPLRQRLSLAQELGMDYLVCLSFTKALADWTADEFIQRIIIGGLAARHIVVGDDFRFGKDRMGDYTMLCDYAARYGFGVSRVAAVMDGDTRVSSTAIRHQLSSGEIATANRLLGSPYRISGRVERGDRLGARLGYPTANLTFAKMKPPLCGVFAVSVHTCGLQLKGIANAGIRPTLSDNRYRIETHIFNFAQDLYGQRLTIYPQHYIRAEHRYGDMAQLKDAIGQDVAVARALLQVE